VAHRGEANRDVPLPRRGVVDQIQVPLLAHAHEVPRTPGVARRAGISGGGDQVLHARDLFRHNVAHGLEDAALDPNQVAHMGTPHPADADEADPDRVHRRGGGEPRGRGSTLGARPGRRSAPRGSAGCGPPPRGQPARATSTAGVAWALGYADGERISRGEMLAVVRRIASTVRVPVTADMEAGYGMTPEAAAETARGVIAAGAVGLNLEDGTNDGRLVD